MLSFIKNIFSSPKTDLPRSVTDSVLGELRLSDDSECWEVLASIDNRTVSFKIGGKRKPDTLLIAHARDIVLSLPEFEQKVSAFLAEEAARHPGIADEIHQLTIQDVCLFWPDRPDDGMIYFKGSDEFRVWRCDYIARKPQGLGFDS